MPTTPTHSAASLVKSIRARHSKILAIVSPPRCSSTAFARAFWRHPQVRYYAHEPFEVTYYDDGTLIEVEEKLRHPLDMAALGVGSSSRAGTALVIKEMPYQVGPRFPLLAELADAPIVFLTRDPRLNIASRMERKREVGESENFPVVESGWELLAEQIGWCERQGVEYMLVDSRDFRNSPTTIFPSICSRYGLDFDADMLDWRPRPDLELDNLGGRHSHLYEKVLGSSGIRPETGEVPTLDSFSVAHGWRAHVERCLTIYRELVANDARVRPVVVGG